ncbi:MAG: hypothetical protein M1829_001169 [Trizodia sp. TS-e1964]|nr:MAG: hypothetical protein M1829_001169 [Trizodia sp. TS-e1964]
MFRHPQIHRAEARQNAQEVEEINTRKSENERQQPALEEAEYDNDISFSEDCNQELDLREEENFEHNQQTPYLYTVSWALKAKMGTGLHPRKAVKWQGKVGETWAQGMFIYNTLDFEVTQAMDRLEYSKLLEVEVTVRLSASKGTRKSISFEDLCQESWNIKVESLIKEEHSRFIGFKLDVTVEFITNGLAENAFGKRPHSAIESPGKDHSPLPRRTGTVQEQERVASRRETNEAIGDFSEKLLDLFKGYM